MRSWCSDLRGHPGWGRSTECSPAVKSYRCRNSDENNSETTHAVLEPQMCSRDWLYTLELSGYIIMLRVFQYLWQAGDDVTLNLHRSCWHQLHELRCQLLQTTRHTPSSWNEWLADMRKKYMIIGLIKHINRNYTLEGCGATRLVITEITTLLSTTLSSHLSWLIIIRGILNPTSPVLWETERWHLDK